MMYSRFFTVLLSSLSFLWLASCTPQTAQTTQDAKATLCTNLAQFNTSVATLKSMSPNSTVGDFRQARDQVKTTFDAVKQSAQTVQEAKTAELEQAYQDLDKAIAGITDGMTLAQATATIAPQVAAVEAAQTQLDAGLQCQ